jgi:hypothetical protein
MSYLQFKLAPEVHVCMTRDGCVFLDLKKDRYLGLGRAEAELLALVVKDWPSLSWERRADSAVKSTQAEEFGRSLAARGLLASARDGGQAHRAALPDMRRPWISVGDELEVPIKLRAKHCANFALAFLFARLLLAWRPFASTVLLVQRRKALNVWRMEGRDIQEVAVLVGVFRLLRPWLFAAENRCLLHALTLVRFLSFYDFYPDWVIGVATQPWAAHSWVQWGDYLLDSNPEKVCRYSPILSV